LLTVENSFGDLVIRLDDEFIGVFDLDFVEHFYPHALALEEDPD
jgi:hypothetical protein